MTDTTANAVPAGHSAHEVSQGGHDGVMDTSSMLPASVPTTYKIILLNLLDMIFDGAWCSNPAFYYSLTTTKEINDAMDDLVEQWADVSYEYKWFALFATKRIRATLDYDLIAREAEHWCWKLLVCELFGDKDGSGEEYNSIMNEWNDRYDYDE
jgi:hypothetical protein